MAACEGRFESIISTNIGQGNVKEKVVNFRNLWLW